MALGLHLAAHVIQRFDASNRVSELAALGAVIFDPEEVAASLLVPVLIFLAGALLIYWIW